MKIIETHVKIGASGLTAEFGLSHPDDSVIGKMLKEENCWEEDLSLFLLGFFTEGKESKFTFLDIGAHVGYFSVLCAECCPKAKIYAFEPNSEIFGLLKENTAKYPNVHTFNAAIGRKLGYANLYCSLDNTGDNSLSEREIKRENTDYTTQKCHIIPFKKTGIDFSKVAAVKIDVQGLEYEIFQQVRGLVPEKTLYIIEEQEDMTEYLKDTQVDKFDWDYAFVE